MPEAFDALVLKAMAIDPLRRFASVEEFAQALAPFGTVPFRRARDSVDIVRGLPEPAGRSAGLFAREPEGVLPRSATPMRVVALALVVATLLVGLGLFANGFFLAHPRARFDRSVPQSAPNGQYGVSRMRRRRCPFPIFTRATESALGRPRERAAT